jgi:hypothetical protein
MAPRTTQARNAAQKRERIVQEDSSPKTTRPEASQRREKERPRLAGQKIGRKLDAVPDRIDIRDWLYRPHLESLPDQLVSCDSVPEILDQGTEGACTGFALSAVINFLLSARNLERRSSPRMIYEMARRYDEWPGEDYEGSSARGAMKGWVRHGVCAATSWPHDLHGPQHFTTEIAQEAQATPGGAYFRVKHREIRDMHAALADVGILYATLMVHEGWGELGKRMRVDYVESGNLRMRRFPVIQRRGRADSGHAVAIVGYTRHGFIVQNSWSKLWGEGGFALLPYEDYMLHATDVWVAQLGVPIDVDLWEEGAADSTEGRQRAARAIPLNEIRPYVINVGNNGELSRSGSYWTTEADISRLFSDLIPSATQNWSKRRVLLYLHGGLNDEEAVARRIVAFRDVLLRNEIYPVHIMWESGFMESLRSMMEDLLTDVDERAGGIRDWLKEFREGLLEARDRTFELTLAASGTALWAEMKENARLASFHPDDRGGLQILIDHARAALEGLGKKEKSLWELHIVGHSAGAIFAAHALSHVIELGLAFKTLQLMAPAVTLDLFKKRVLPFVYDGQCPRPTLYILSDTGERDDDVGLYGKSLLYLVSNAFEGQRETRLLGMQRFIDEQSDDADKEVSQLFQRSPNGLPGLVLAGKSRGLGSRSRSESHGGFDNDPDTMNSVLYRILGKRPRPEFTLRDLQF